MLGNSLLHFRYTIADTIVQLISKPEILVKITTFMFIKVPALLPLLSDFNGIYEKCEAGYYMQMVIHVEWISITELSISLWMIIGCLQEEELCGVT